MKALELSPDLKVPADLVTQTVAILAMRGVGKTHTASVMAEEFAEAGLPFAVLDPTGAWWGLRSSPDGKSTGYPVTILGGDHGDVPLEETAGKMIADLVAEQAPSLILDLSRLSKSAMRRFVADFAERLYEKNRNPLHLIIDEADAFAPQKPRPDEMRMLGAIDEIVRRGRIKGLGCTLVTQRSAVLNKDVLTQCEVLIALRTAHPRDRAPVLEWMKVHATPEQLAQVEESLAKLPKGDAWIMSAGWLDLFKRVHIRERRTFNSSATPAPGQRRIVPKVLAPVDLKALEERMAETIERAKATDPKLLQAKVRDLEAQLAKAAMARPPPAPKERRVEVSILKAEHVAKLERAADATAKAAEGLVNAAAMIAALVGESRSRQLDAGEERLKASAAATHDADMRKPTPHFHGVPVVPRPRRERTETNGEITLKKGARAMLQALAAFDPKPLTRQELGVHAGLAIGGTFSDYLSALRTAGLIEEDGGAVGLTAQGRAYFPHVPPKKTTQELVELWHRKLKLGARRMFEVLVAHNGEPLSREQLGELAGLAIGGTFSDYLSALRSNGLLEDHGRDVAASHSLFLG